MKLENYHLNLDESQAFNDFKGRLEYTLIKNAVNIYNYKSNTQN